MVILRDVEACRFHRQVWWCQIWFSVDSCDDKPPIGKDGWNRFSGSGDSVRRPGRREEHQDTDFPSLSQSLLCDAGWFFFSTWGVIGFIRNHCWCTLWWSVILSILLGCWLPSVVQSELGSLVSLRRAHRLVARWINFCWEAAQIWLNFCWEAVTFGAWMIIPADILFHSILCPLSFPFQTAVILRMAGEKQPWILSYRCVAVATPSSGWKLRSFSSTISTSSQMSDRDAEAQTHPLQGAWEGWDGGIWGMAENSHFYWGKWG